MRRTGPDTATRTAVYERDRWRCLWCGGDFGGLQVHHRRPRGMGSTRRPESNGLANLVLLCGLCHSSVETHRATALELGLLVGQHADPSEVPLRVRGRILRLRDDGTVTGHGATA